jgi:hypothetical protein
MSRSNVCVADGRIVEIHQEWSLLNSVNCCDAEVSFKNVQDVHGHLIDLKYGVTVEIIKATSVER